MGLIPAWAPRTLQDARIRGRRSVEDLVDRHQLRNREIRDLMVEYLRRRSAEVDYATTENLVRCLIEYFWKIIEQISPDQADLSLSQEQVQAWKERLLVRKDGKPRAHIEAPFLTVRAFYLDLQTWAAAEPERWARWVAPSPIQDADLRWFNIRKRRIRERMAARTRERQPLLAILSQHVNDNWQRLRVLLDAASKAQPGEQFIVDGTAWQRVAEPRGQQPESGWQSVRVVNRDTRGPAAPDPRGRQRLLGMGDHRGAPARRDAPGGAGRAHAPERPPVPAAQRRGHRAAGDQPLQERPRKSRADVRRAVPRHRPGDPSAHRQPRHRPGLPPLRPARADLVRAASLPVPADPERDPRALSISGVRQVVVRAARRLVPTHPEFAEVRFSPHDFRRLFITELVNNGLPIHIGAALLGHLNIQTTRGYVAVFEEDVVRHYQEFLERRRAMRPEGEYRKPTDDEWADFNEHFDKRKVELGGCGRPYGTSCAHEHACIRCSMLSVNPKMLPRLDEIEADLVARRQRATGEGWHGEIEGIDLTLSYLHGKRAQAQRAAAASPVSLGMPVVRGR